MTTQRLPRIVVLGLIGTAVLVCAGCSRRATFRLARPDAPPAQQLLHLKSDQAFCAARAGRQACVVTFPLPGSEQGPRAFVAYLVTPAGTGPFEVRPEDPGAAAGFLVQEVGQLQGHTAYAGGTVRLSTNRLRPHWRKLELDVELADGGRLTGTALLEDLPRAVRSIERAYAAEVRELTDGEPRGHPREDLASDADEAEVDAPGRDSPQRGDGL
jgi:hypothetical protein